MKNKVISKRVVIFILIAISPFIAIYGLMYNPNVSANYFYEGTDANYEWGKVSIVTQGVGHFFSPFTVPEKDDRTIVINNVCGDFTIYFEAHGVMNGTVKVTNLEITDLDNNKKVKTPKIRYNNVSLSERKPVKWDSNNYEYVEYGSGPYIAYVCTEEHRLQFVDYKISFNFTIKTADSEISSKTTLFLKKKKIEYTRWPLISV